MHIEQFYTSCLSEAAYYIESNGEAAIIDPLRDIKSYIDIAKERNCTIKYIFETHFHADFVSGHLELQKATGATIVYGPNAKTNFPIYQAKDGEVISIGNIGVKILHTPGHTMESTCYLLQDESGKPHCIFTGDTLFLGDVGRPDLAQKGAELTMEDLAGTLYDSLQSKIIPLPDDLIVYPAHGAGSSCGKSLSKETFDTLGNQKKTNYALQPQTKEEFVKAVIEGLAAPPQYFPINAQINKSGYGSLDSITTSGLTALSNAEVAKLSFQEDVFLLDTRNELVFTQGFVPNSINIGLNGRFAEWAGSLIPFDKKIIIIAEKGKVEESIIRLARVGLDNIIGHLAGGFEAWQEAGLPIDLIIDIEADELAMDIVHDGNAVVVDVRKESEFADGHIDIAKNLPLSEMTDPGNLSFIDEKDNMYIHCAGGYRSVIAASMLKKQGYHNLRNVLGGWASIKNNSDKFNFVKDEVAISK